jgi:cardiolipin synthase
MHAAWVRTMLRRDWKQHLRKLLDQPQRVRQFRRLMVKVLRSADDELPDDLRYQRGADTIATIPALHRLTAPPPEPGNVRAALALRNNLSRRRTIERAYIDAISRSSKRIAIVTPYFFPGMAFRRALSAAARRGVQVDLVLQGLPDFEFAELAARALYAELLRAGVHIHEYTRSFLHGKVALVDDAWATVGSSNIDPLSLLLAREANVVVTDAAFNRVLAVSVDSAIADSRRVELSDARGSLFMRFKERAAVIVVRLFIALIGGARRY